MNFTFTSLASDYHKASSNFQHISFKKSHKINVIHCIILKDILNFSIFKDTSSENLRLYSHYRYQGNDNSSEHCLLHLKDLASGP